MQLYTGPRTSDFGVCSYVDEQKTKCVANYSFAKRSKYLSRSNFV